MENNIKVVQCKRCGMDIILKDEEQIKRANESPTMVHYCSWRCAVD